MKKLFNIKYFIAISKIKSMDNSISEKIEIYLCCRNIKDLDVFTKSDPYVRISYRRDFTQKQYSLLGRTETVPNNLNPNFTKTFTLDYIFESRQDIKFDVFDDDSKGDNDDYLGTVETTVGALMGARGQTSILDLKNPSKSNEPAGKLVVRCEKLIDSNGKIPVT
jgi:Ca2+-dependent lipid-binding protein